MSDSRRVKMEDLVRLKLVLKCITNKAICEQALDLTWELTDEQGEYEFDGVPFKQSNGYRVLTIRYLDIEPWDACLNAPH